MKRLDEIYKDFELNPAPSITLFSYGESVEACQDIDFRRVVERAERRAKWHHDLLDTSKTSPFSIVKRQWWCSDPTQVVVHVYSRSPMRSADT